MNIRQLMYKLGEAIVIEALRTDERLKNAYLEMAREKWPRHARLEELLADVFLEKFFRQDLWQLVEARMQVAIPRDTNLPNILELPGQLYLEVVQGESHGFTSHTIGQVKAQAVPRLLAQIEARRSHDDASIDWTVLTSAVGDELAALIAKILTFRREFTDRATIGLFPETVTVTVTESCPT